MIISKESALKTQAAATTTKVARLLGDDDKGDNEELGDVDVGCFKSSGPTIRYAYMDLYSGFVDHKCDVEHVRVQ